MEHKIRAKEAQIETIGTADGETALVSVTKQAYIAPFDITEDLDIPYRSWVLAMLAGAQKKVINKTQANVIDDGNGGGYIEYKDNLNAALPVNVMPYSISNVIAGHTYPVPAVVENDPSWAFPRIYGFNPPGTTQTITILAI